MADAELLDRMVAALERIAAAGEQIAAELRTANGVEDEPEPEPAPAMTASPPADCQHPPATRQPVNGGGFMCGTCGRRIHASA